MLKSLLVLSSLSMSLTAFAAPPQKAMLQASLTTGYMENLKESITITSNDKGVWTIETFHECEKYPCSVADQTTQETTSVVSVMDARAGDGPLVVTLANGMVVSERATGFMMMPPKMRKDLPPPYTLDLKIDGKDTKLPLSIEARILSK